MSNANCAARLLPLAQAKELITRRGSAARALAQQEVGR